MLNSVNKILLSRYPNELANKIVELYSAILFENRRKSWKNCISNIGQFNEVCYRLIEFELTGVYIPFNQQLPKFTNQTLIKWENIGNKPEIYRVIMPRILYGMYSLRSKRGAIHVSNIDPNEMDTSIMLSQVKWFLAEIIRNITNVSFNETSEIIKNIINKENEIIWEVNGVLRILDTKLKTEQKILSLLYSKDKQTFKELFNNTEYKNSTNFKLILKKMHNKKLIEYAVDKIFISPKGILEVEKYLNKF